jgi:putative peptidoglycan lipid II flippase
MMPTSTLLFVLTAVYAYASAELISQRRFFLAAITPALSSGISLLVIVISSDKNAELLLKALLIGTFVQALFAVFPSWGIGKPGRVNLVRAEVWAPLRSQIALVAVSTLGVLNSFVDQFFSTRLGPGSISALNYASTLNNVLMQIVVMSVGWGALPKMSDLASNGDLKSLVILVRRCVLAGVACTAVATASVFLFGEVLIDSVFQHGKFDSDSSRALFIAWAGYSIGLVPAAMSMMAARLANALQANELLLKLGLVLCVTNGVADFLLMRWFGLIGIAASTSLVYLCSAILLYTFIGRNIGRVLDGATVKRLFIILAITSFASLPLVAFRLTGNLSLGRAFIAMMNFGVALLALYSAAGIIRIRRVRPYLEIAWNATA